MHSRSPRSARTAAIALALSICAGCSSGNDGDQAVARSVDATAPSSSDDAASDAAGADAFVPLDAGCAAQLAQLDSAYTADRCSMCIQNNCTFFTGPCSMNCTCVDATLALLACVKIAANRSDCVGGVRSQFTAEEVNQLVLCEGICDKPCGDGDDDDSGAADDADGGPDAS